MILFPAEILTRKVLVHRKVHLIVSISPHPKTPQKPIVQKRAPRSHPQNLMIVLHFAILVNVHVWKIILMIQNHSFFKTSSAFERMGPSYIKTMGSSSTLHFDFWRDRTGDRGKKNKTSTSHPNIDVSKNSGFSPQIIHFNRVFHYFHHPFWG